jgi:hypothetical protein
MIAVINTSVHLYMRAYVQYHVTRCVEQPLDMPSCAKRCAVQIPLRREAWHEALRNAFNLYSKQGTTV